MTYEVRLVSHICINKKSINLYFFIKCTCNMHYVHSKKSK